MNFIPASIKNRASRQPLYDLDGLKSSLKYHHNCIK